MREKPRLDWADAVVDSSKAGYDAPAPAETPRDVSVWPWVLHASVLFLVGAFAYAVGLLIARGALQ
jgi:hypothetical protein